MGIKDILLRFLVRLVQTRINVGLTAQSSDILSKDTLYRVAYHEIFPDNVGENWQEERR